MSTSTKTSEGQTSTFDLIDDEMFSIRLKEKGSLSKARVVASFSTYLGGFSVEPHHAVIAMDDHLMHRGDGVFEAMKVTPRGIYLFDAHIDRLFQSAEYIGLTARLNRSELAAMCQRLLEIARGRYGDDLTGVMRVYWSRGPGSFAVNPYDVSGPEIYAVVQGDVRRESGQGAQAFAIVKTNPKPVRVMFSRFPVKWDFFANAKTCNYLVNVMMKKEAIDAGFDYAVALDENGAIAESSTENIAFLRRNGELVCPPFQRMLKGATLNRLMELAVNDGIVVEQRAINPSELKQFAHAFLISTTLDVSPISEFGGVQFRTEGPHLDRLSELLRKDIETF